MSSEATSQRKPRATVVRRLFVGKRTVQDGLGKAGHVALSRQRSLAPSVAAAAPAGCSTCAPRDVAGGHHPSWLAALSAAPPAALPRRGRRRRSRSSPSASALCNSWDDVFAEGLPCLASERLRPGTLPALDRWRDHDYLVRHLPDVTVHESTPPTVQMMSEVQPLASELAELAWHRPWRERNISSRHLFRSGALDDASFGADGGGNHGGISQPAEPATGAPAPLSRLLPALRVHLLAVATLRDPFARTSLGDEAPSWADARASQMRIGSRSTAARSRRQARTARQPTAAATAQRS